MKEIESIESLERVAALLHPLRARILALAAEPISALELATELGETPQKLNYHLKALEKAGLVRKAREEKVGNLTKAYYQAQAKRLWFSPDMVLEKGADARAARDQVSLHHLLGLARELERDVIALLNRSKKGDPTASLGVRADLAFENGEARRAFLDAYMRSLEDLIRRFGARDPATAAERYTATLAVHPARGRRGKNKGGNT